MISGYFHEWINVKSRAHIAIRVKHIFKLLRLIEPCMLYFERLSSYLKVEAFSFWSRLIKGSGVDSYDMSSKQLGLTCASKCNDPLCREPAILLAEVRLRARECIDLLDECEKSVAYLANEDQKPQIRIIDHMRFRNDVLIDAIDVDERRFRRTKYQNERDYLVISLSLNMSEVEIFKKELLALLDQISQLGVVESIIEPYADMPPAEIAAEHISEGINSFDEFILAKQEKLNNPTDPRRLNLDSLNVISKKMGKQKVLKTSLISTKALVSYMDKIRMQESQRMCSLKSEEIIHPEVIKHTSTAKVIKTSLIPSKVLEEYKERLRMSRAS